jgi:signal transduction histidine kinase/EAL domain-containing protein (putative c-di-GMP-specific phosphodiesterase class I)
VVFSSSEGTVAIAEAAAVQVRAQETIGVLGVTRAIFSEAILFSIAYQQDGLSQDAFDTVISGAEATLVDLDRQRASLEVVLHDVEVNQALASYIVAGTTLLADLKAGRLEVARSSGSLDFREAYDRAIVLLVAERDRRERDIAAVRAGLAEVADGARFVVAFFVPALTILWMLGFIKRRQKRARLEAEIEQEEGLRTAKDEFLSAIAHELRTPLTAVVGFAQTLRDRSRELSLKDREELVEILADQASGIAFMVEDLLVFARANIGDLTIRAQAVPVRALIEGVAMIWGGRHDGRLTFVGEGTVWADPLRMKQIARNLLSNAFDHGGPIVEVRILQNGPDVKIEVADNGPGIPIELRAQIFEPYQHGVSSEGQTAPMGLGLTVARSLARLMGGDLEYHYRGGQSVFEVTFARATQEQIRRSRLPNLRAALCADGPSSSHIIEAIQHKQFEIVYQPIIDLRHPSGDRRVVGFEALARFPTGSPPEWFAVAWGAGIGVELELEAIRAAVEGFRHAPHRTFLALNTSMETLTSPNLPQALAGLAPSRIVLELSEDTVIDNYPRTKVYIDRLTRRGYRLAFDDLAAGRIDLWYLVRLRPAIIKIDISLIRDIDQEPSKRALVNGLKWLGDVLKSQIVAEGIERPEELELLTRIGAHYGQGYLLGLPGPLAVPTDPTPRTMKTPTSSTSLSE